MVASTVFLNSTLAAWALTHHMLVLINPLLEFSTYGIVTSDIAMPSFTAFETDRSIACRAV